VIQVAAVLGRQFRRGELLQLLEDEGIDLGHELADLEARGLVHRKSLLSSDEYRFGESLTQDVAYETLLLRQRRQLHERIGLLLEAEPGEIGTERSALLAHHFARSDNRAKAVAALLRAAGDAERLPAYRSAVDLFRQAWEVAEAGLAESDDDQFRTAVLQATAGLCRVAVIYGLPVPESERAASRARELAEAAGNVETLSSLYYFQGTLLMQGDREQHAQGLALAEQGLLVAQQSNLTVHALRLSRGLAIQYALDGRFALAQRVATWAVQELEKSGEKERLTDLYISSRWVQDSVYYMGDELDTVLTWTRETYDLAVRGPNRTVQGAAAGTLAHVYLMRGDYKEARHWADVSVEMAEAIGHALVLPPSAAIAALARLELGEPVDAARHLEALEQAAAVTGNTALNHRFIGEALFALGDRDRAERYAEALRAHPFGGRFRSASVALALGELMSRFERLDEAERWYGEAITLADALGARTVLALASLGTAELLAARGHQRDGSRLAARALAICRDLGLARYEPRATRLAVDAAALTG
jgi:tetratricopeptide (TPR) repeat protein